MISKSPLRSFFAIAAAAVSFMAPAIPALAKGVVTIQQSDGTTNVYDDVSIQIIHNALYLTSADGKGTIVVNRAACSYQGALLVCLPTDMTLIQSGATNPIKLTTGTIYVNLTSDPQQLVLSTTKVPPHSVLVSFTTKRGTYVALSGRIDRVK